MRRATSKRQAEARVAPDARLCRMPAITEARADDWVAACPKCGGRFAVRAGDERSPGQPPAQSHCPDCRCRGSAAPGALVWRRRSKQCLT